MKRKLTLYIADQLADMDDDSFILMNYAFEDLNNPTVVKNSFSQGVTLPGTGRNGIIFNTFYRLDRVTSTGFNALKRTPFTIYDDRGEILVSGYLKLNSVKRKGRAIQSYTVTLYGGLGGFFYNLSYNDNGGKMTLADLDYLGTGDVSELDFDINAATIADAWSRAYQYPMDLPQNAVTSKWDVINFAPMLNGFPVGEFDADKGVTRPSNLGLADTQDRYGVKDGLGLFSFPEKVTEWQVKDLRSYLQRPVISMSAILKAIADPDNNGGYNVDYSDIVDEGADLWMTLPMLPSLGTYRQERGSLGLSFPAVTTSEDKYFDVSFDQTLQEGASAKITANIGITALVSGTTQSVLYPSCNLGYGTSAAYEEHGCLVQILAYSSAGEIVTGSPVFAIGGVKEDVKYIARSIGYTPAFGELYGSFITGVWERQSNGYYRFSKDVSAIIDGYNISSLKVRVTPYMHYFEPGDETMFDGFRIASPAFYASEEENANYAGVVGIGAGQGVSVVSYETASSVRSGSHITKQMLLSSDNTPADYLLSYAKLFGYYFTFDATTNTIRMLKRGTLFNGNVIDLTTRIDAQDDFDIIPYVIDTKWLDYTLQSLGGAFSDLYLSIQGREYGSQRLDTGYEFNEEHRNALQGNVFRAGVSVNDTNALYQNLSVSGYYRPSPFLLGATYSLYDGNGDSVEIAVPQPSGDGVVVTYFSSTNPGSLLWKNNSILQMADAENKCIEGGGVLLYHYGVLGLPANFKVSDDTTAMLNINDGTPCWDLTPSANQLNVPYFSRYKIAHIQSHGLTYDRLIGALDVGVPMTVQIPSFPSYGDEMSIFDRKWRNYLTDRYDIDTKVVTCKVDWSGMQVGEGLLRNFYWFDNAVWTLNRIINYSVTSDVPCECEFVKVNDRTAYTTSEDALTPFLFASSGVLGIPSTAQSVNLPVYSNRGWTASSDSPWLTLSPSSGEGNGTIAVTVTANDSATPRTAVITLTSADPSVAPYVIQVTQDVSQGRVPLLSVTPTLISCKYDTGGYAVVTVEAERAWTISTDKPYGKGDGWIELNRAAGPIGTTAVQVWVYPRQVGGSYVEENGTITVSDGISTITLPVVKEGIAGGIKNISETLTLKINGIDDNIEVSKDAQTVNYDTYLTRVTTYNDDHTTTSTIRTGIAVVLLGDSGATLDTSAKTLTFTENSATSQRQFTLRATYKESVASHIITQAAEAAPEVVSVTDKLYLYVNGSTKPQTISGQQQTLPYDAYVMRVTAFSNGTSTVQTIRDGITLTLTGTGATLDKTRSLISFVKNESDIRSFTLTAQFGAETLARFITQNVSVVTEVSRTETLVLSVNGTEEGPVYITSAAQDVPFAAYVAVDVVYSDGSTSHFVEDPTLSVTGGTISGGVIKVTKNTATSQKNVNVSASYKGETKTMTIVQAAGNVQFSAIPAELRYGGSANDGEIGVLSNATWSVESSAPWMTVTKVSSTKVAVHVDANHEGSRNATVIFKVNGVVVGSCMVYQAAPVVSFGIRIGNDDILLPAGGGQDSFEVFGQTYHDGELYGEEELDVEDVEILSYPSFIDLTDFTVSAESLGAVETERNSGTIVISWNNETAMVTVSQEANVIESYDYSPSSISLGEYRGTRTNTASADGDWAEVYAHLIMLAFWTSGDISEENLSDWTIESSNPECTYRGDGTIAWSRNLGSSVRSATLNLRRVGEESTYIASIVTTQRGVTPGAVYKVTEVMEVNSSNLGIRVTMRTEDANAVSKDYSGVTRGESNFDLQTNLSTLKVMVQRYYGSDNVSSLVIRAYSGDIVYTGSYSWGQELEIPLRYFNVGGERQMVYTFQITIGRRN